MSEFNSKSVTTKTYKISSCLIKGHSMVSAFDVQSQSPVAEAKKLLEVFAPEGYFFRKAKRPNGVEYTNTSMRP